MTDADADPTPESLLPALKNELGAECEGVTDESLLAFLNWKPSVDRASERFRSFKKWKSADENKGLFDENLRLSKDSELERVILSEVLVTPPNLFARDGTPILIGRFRNNDMTDGRTVADVCRMAFYTVDRLLHLPETRKHGVIVVHDLRGFDRSKNVHMELPKKLFGALIGQFPVNIKAVYICHAPVIFYGFFKIVSLFLGKKVRKRFHFCDSFEELATVHDIMDPKDLLKEMGGSKEFSIKDWVEENKAKEQSGDWKSLTML